jgi:hypothetical protein
LRLTDEAFELERMCNHILRELGENKPNISAQITKQMKRPEYSQHTSLQRKFEKIRMLSKIDMPFLESVLAGLNRAAYEGPRSPLNCIELMQRMMPYFNPTAEISGGNYRKL